MKFHSCTILCLFHMYNTVVQQLPIILNAHPPLGRLLTVHIWRCYRIIDRVLHAVLPSTWQIYIVIANYCAPLSPSSSLPVYPNSSPLVTTSHFSVSMIVCCCFVPSVLLCVYTPNISEIRWYLCFYAWLISLSMIPMRYIYVVANNRIFFFFFLWLNTFPLCMCTTSSFSVHQLMDTWVASISWLLQMVL